MPEKIPKQNKPTSYKFVGEMLGVIIFSLALGWFLDSHYPGALLTGLNVIYARMNK